MSHADLLLDEHNAPDARGDTVKLDCPCSLYIGSQRLRRHLITSTPSVVYFLLCILVAAVLCIPLPSKVAYTTILVLSFVLSVPVTVAVHELGHSIAGVLVGFVWYFTTIPFFRFSRVYAEPHMQASQVRVFAYRGWRQAIAGNVTISLPQAPGPRIGTYAVIVLLAGSMMNFVLAAVVLGPLTPTLLHTAAIPPVTAVSLGITSVITLAGVSVLMGVWNLLPLSGHGFSSDGRVLLWAVKGSIEWIRYIAIMKLVGHSNNGDRPRAWPLATVESALSINDTSVYEGMSCILGYYHHFDSGDIDQARSILARGYRVCTHLPLPFLSLAETETLFLSLHLATPCLSRDATHLALSRADISFLYSLSRVAYTRLVTARRHAYAYLARRQQQEPEYLDDHADHEGDHDGHPDAHRSPCAPDPLVCEHVDLTTVSVSRDTLTGIECAEVDWLAAITAPT